MDLFKKWRGVIDLRIGLRTIILYAYCIRYDTVDSNFDHYILC